MSHDLHAVARDCLGTLSRLGIPVGIIREIAPDTRSRRRWGVCRKDADGTFRILISVRLLSDDAPLDALRDTLFHELLHTAPNCMNHTGNWKQYAERLNKELGLNITRATTADSIGVPEDDRIRYRFVCRGCGTVQIRYRSCKFTNHPERYRCALCGGTFQQI